MNIEYLEDSIQWGWYKKDRRGPTQKLADKIVNELKAKPRLQLMKMQKVDLLCSR